jgi:hypothetical protein
LAITVQLDVTDGSQVEYLGTNPIRAIRAGRARGLPTDTSSMDPEAVLFAVTQAARTAAGASGPDDTPTYPGHSSLLLTRTLVSGISNTAQAASVKLVYEPFSGAAASSLIFDVGSSLSTFATNQMPGTRKLFAVGWSDSPPTGDEEDFFANAVPVDYPVINMLRGCGRVSVTQLQVGTLDVTEAATFSSYVERVNDAEWMGRPKGSWIVSEAQAQISRYAGYYTKRISALRLGDDAWSYYTILRNALTGKYVGTPTAMQANQAALKALDYEPRSIRWPSIGTSPDANWDGIARIDPYLDTDFGTLFGFGAPEEEGGG